MRGYAKEGVPEKIRAAGGEIYAITSEPQGLASRAQEEWGFGFESVGDPHHEIVGTCRERGWLDLFVNPRLGFLRSSAPAELGWTPQHPKGYFQPGVLVLGADGRVLYRWRGVPSRKNMGGATERPTAEHVWSRVESALESAGPDTALDSDPPLDSRGVPWPLFVSLLVANGWFVRPRGFAHLEGGPPPQVRAQWALFRVVGFAAAWIAAFTWLPTLPVAAGLAGWIAWITPRIRVLNAEFQNVRAA
ncbi:MAG: hypothetical protein ABFS41_00985 [Myxococcota bacterium]